MGWGFEGSPIFSPFVRVVNKFKTMPRNADFYAGTKYSRQFFVIETEFYRELQGIANEDPSRRLKTGDVIKTIYDLAKQWVPPEVIEQALEDARDAKPPRKSADV